MKHYLLRNLSELAHKRAINLREEALLWDILARDLKREAARLEEEPAPRRVRAPTAIECTTDDKDNVQPLFVGIAEAARRMGISRSSLYTEIAASRIKVRKSGRRTLIAIADINAWFETLPEGVRL